MWFFALALLCLYFGLKFSLGGLRSPFSDAAERARLHQVCALLQELEETLAAGIAPESSRWERLQSLPAPWGDLATSSIRELRSGGSALLPTLHRLRLLAQEHAAALLEARAKSAQALAQAVICGALAPAFGLALYWLLPGIEAHALFWFVACATASGWSCVGAYWMLSMSHQARWAGLSATARPWVLASQCAGERFLALVRSGNPADLAWTRAHALLLKEAPGLAYLWGASIWKVADGEKGGAEPGPLQKPRALAKNAAEQALCEAGDGIRKAVQVSLMEGRPCTDRVETALTALRQSLRALVDRELLLLGTRAMKPLFFCVAPALFALLATGFWLCWTHVDRGGF